MKLFVGEIFPEVKINEDEQQHMLKVLRMRDGDLIHITDGEGNLAKGNLVVEGKRAKVAVEEIFTKTEPFSPRLHVAIAPTKNMDRIEFFVEKAVEMGISEITFIQTEKSERKAINLERLQKQAVAASKQSLRFHFPVLNELTKLTDFIQNCDSSNTFVAHCHENLERSNLIELEKNLNVTLLIGPEGDFSEREIAALKEAGIAAVSLGPQRLRTETAGLFVAAWNYKRMFS